MTIYYDYPFNFKFLFIYLFIYLFIDISTAYQMKQVFIIINLIYVNL